MIWNWWKNAVHIFYISEHKIPKIIWFEEDTSVIILLERKQVIVFRLRSGKNEENKI